MLNFNSIMINTGNVEAMNAFYEAVFERKADMHEGGWYGWSAGDGYVSINEHSEVKGKAKEPQRFLVNFETKEVKEEFERIKKIGAEIIKEPYEMGGGWIATFTDPDGNYLQLVTPWE